MELCDVDSCLFKGLNNLVGGFVNEDADDLNRIFGLAYCVDNFPGVRFNNVPERFGIKVDPNRVCSGFHGKQRVSWIRYSADFNSKLTIHSGLSSIFGPLDLCSAKMLSHRLPLLITGIAGVAGYSAFHYFKELFPGQVFGLRPKVNWKLDEEGALACDLEDHDQLSKLFEKHRFGAVLHCGGSCALKSCELDPIMANRVNVLAVDSLLTAMEKNPGEGQPPRLVFFSIDLVYSGYRGGAYIETDRPDPVTVYGRTMWAGEKLVANRFGDAAILRISLPMGVSFNGHAGAVDWIASRFYKGLPATLYFDEVRTPTYTHCLNRVANHFLNGEQRGIYHAGGPSKRTLFEIAQIVNRVGGFSPELLHGCYRIEAGPMPPRAGNVSMDSSKIFEEFDGDPFLEWPLDRELVPTDRNWHYQRIEKSATVEQGNGVKFGAEIERLLYQPNRLRPNSGNV